MFIWEMKNLPMKKMHQIIQVLLIQLIALLKNVKTIINKIKNTLIQNQVMEQIKMQFQMQLIQLQNLYLMLYLKKDKKYQFIQRREQVEAPLQLQHIQFLKMKILALKRLQDI